MNSMFRVSLLLICFLLLVNDNAARPPSTLCEVGEIVQYEERVAELNKQEVFAFLKLTDASCFLNVEFQQYFNEVLFQIADLHGILLAESLSLLTPINRKIILSELSSPINDGIPVDSIRRKLSLVEAPMLCRALDMAIAARLPLTTNGGGFQQKEKLVKGTLLAAEVFCDTLDFNGDGIPEKVTFARGPVKKQHSLRFTISLPDGAAKTILLNDLIDDDLSWVSHIALIPRGQWLSPALRNEATGDILGIDVEASVLLKTTGIIMTPEESEGALVVYFQAGALMHLYL